MKGAVVAVTVVGGFTAIIFVLLIRDLIRQHDANIRDAGFQHGVHVERSRWTTAARKLEQMHGVGDEGIVSDLEQLGATSRLFFNVEDWS